MQRKIDQWKNCSPRHMVLNQSDTALIFAIEAAKADILALHAGLHELLTACKDGALTADLINKIEVILK